MWWIAIIVAVLLLIVGIILLPEKPREVAVRVVFFPIAWLLCILTFPVHYFKNIGYNKKKPVPIKAIRIKSDDDFMVKVVHKNGEEEIIKPFEEVNENVNCDKK